MNMQSTARSKGGKSIQHTRLCAIEGKSPKHSRQSANIHLAIFLFLLLCLLVVEGKGQLLYFSKVILDIHIYCLAVC